MAKTNFYLKNPDADSESLIYLFFSFDGKRLKYSTARSVSPKHWNASSQRMKKSLTDAKGFNLYLDKIERHVKAFYLNLNLEGKSVTCDKLRTMLDEELNREGKQKAESFMQLVEQFIHVLKPTMKPNTIKKYNTLKNHLNDFQKHSRKRLTFEGIDPAFYEQFVVYLMEEKELINNSIGKYIQTLKTFLNWATERGHNQSMAYRKFKVMKEEADTIYLTELEVMHLLNMDIKSERLQKVRDLLCFACFTGLRYSDLVRVNQNTVIGNKIHLRAVKTKDSLIIPISNHAQKILDRHEGILPQISNQKFNKYIKELGELAGINQVITKTVYKGAEVNEIKEPKYKFLCSHTGRRTFVTLSLEKGMRQEVLMRITGHKSTRTLKRYIRLTDSVVEREMKQIWSDEGLKIAI